jgi:hypothetical protein
LIAKAIEDLIKVRLAKEQDELLYHCLLPSAIIPP